MNWLEVARQKRALQMQYLEASLPSYSVPIIDDADHTPGWLYMGEIYSAVPDVMYPVDPAVLRAIRDEFCADVVPITVKSIWRRSRMDSAGEPEILTLVRHCIARRVQDAKRPLHEFRTEMPCSGGIGYWLDVPNYIELNWYDREERPYGMDMPGRYLPFDWQLYYDLRANYQDALSAKEQVRQAMKPVEEREKDRMRKRVEQANQDRELANYHERLFAQASDPELKEYLLGDVPAPERAAQVSVGQVAAENPSAPAPEIPVAVP